MKSALLISSFLKRFLLAITLAAGISQASAQTRVFFDTNGATNWFGLAVGGSYTWDTSAFWSTSETGNVATTPWTDGNIAAFRLFADNGTAFKQDEQITINLAQNVTVAGLENTQNGITLLQAATAKTINVSGATIHANGGVVGRAGLVIGDNVNLSGNFTLTSGASASFHIRGEGDAYNGTITVNATGLGGLVLDSTTRIASSVKIVLNSGSVITPAQYAGATIGELSGTGGQLRSFGQSTITINQSTNTTWGGEVAPGAGGVGFLSIVKQGSGRLSFTNTDAVHNSSSSNWNIEAGSLYVGGKIVNANGTGVNAKNHNINVSAGATFGGTVNTDRRVVLLAADSVLDAGYYEAVGTLNLSAGVRAQNGGTFHFDLSGANASRINFGNSLELSGTGNDAFLQLDGVKTINLYNIGLLQNLALNTPYVLMDATASGAAWNMNDWHFNLAGGNWGSWVGDTENVLWTLTGDKLTVTFIPEPSSLLLLMGTIGAFGMLLQRNRKRR